MCIIPYTAVLLLKDGVYHLLELSAPSSGSIKMIDQVATLFITDLLTHHFFYIESVFSAITHVVITMAMYKLVGHMKMRGRDAFDERFGPGENSTPRKVFNYKLPLLLLL